MRRKKIKSPGQVPTIALIIGIIIIVLVIVILVVLKMIRKPPPPPPQPVEKEPVYEITVANVKFKLVEAKDRGNRLLASESKNPEYIREDLVTTDRFVEITVSAENVGKDNIPPNVWDIKEVVDKEGRKFYPLEHSDPWILKESHCGALLKPGFTPLLVQKYTRSLTLQLV